MHRVQKFVLIGFTMTVTSIFLITIGNNAFAVEFANYTSEKYGIQFEYPTDWTVKEKTSRFDDGADIQIKSGESDLNQFNIHLHEDPETAYGSSDVETATEDLLRSSKTALYRYDVKTIEDPSYFTIDGQKTGTFLISFKDKYEDFGVKGAQQQWNVFVGDRAYQISNVVPTSSFDNPENLEIRNHFINSIKFLGDTEPQQKSLDLIENEEQYTIIINQLYDKIRL